VNIQKPKEFQLRGGFAPDSLTRGRAHVPRWGLCLQTPYYMGHTLVFGEASNVLITALELLIWGRLKMQDWKTSDESAGLEFNRLAMRARVRKTQLNEGSCHKIKLNLHVATLSFNLHMVAYD